MKVIGIDAPTCDMIKPHRDEMPNFDKLIKERGYRTDTVEETPKSAPL